MIKITLNTTIITSIDDVYNLDLNIIRKFDDSYIAKNEERAFEFFMLDKRVIDELILDHASSIQDSIDEEEYNYAREFAITLQDLCKLKSGEVNKIKLW